MNVSKHYRKKPVVIEAFKLESRYLNWPEWAHDALTKNEIISHNMGKFFIPSEPSFIEIKTLKGVMRAVIGDYIIRGVKGEIYPCKPDIFEMTY